MAVAQREAALDGDDDDRRQHRAAVLGDPDALPAAAGLLRRPELRVELLRPVGLDGRADRLQRDLVTAGQHRQPGAPEVVLVEHWQAAGLVAAAQPARERRAAAGAD